MDMPVGSAMGPGAELCAQLPQSGDPLFERGMVKLYFKF
jgi:hypothetical protein